MRPAHDVDALILMATALAAKRRPADLVGIVAAAELLQGFMPFADKLGEAIRRLSSLGLIGILEEGFTLTAAAQAIMAQLPKKAATEDRLIALKHLLADHAPTGQAAPLVLTAEQLDAAIQAHKLARKTPGKNMLMPKPKVDRHFKVDGRWRRAAATPGRKSARTRPA